MKSDLHLHTTCSDGKLTPEQLTELAFSRGLGAIAITDHDTVDGIERAVKKAQYFSNPEVIPGIEINAFLDNQEVHVLGYFIDYTNPKLKSDLLGLQTQRKERAIKIIDKLGELGFNIKYEDVLSKVTGASVGRPHIAQALVEKGHAKSEKQSFDELLNQGRPAYIPRKKLSPFEAIDVIKAYKGIPVIAHPGLLKDPTIIKPLSDYGLMGIEAYHTKHTLEQSEHFMEIGKRYNLIITGGSDSHDAPTVGTVTAPSDCVDALKKAKETLGVVF